MCVALDDDGLSYAGPVNITADGAQCESWETAQYHRHINPAKMPEDNFTLAENYCRNPNEDVIGPSCYFLGSLWAKCDIPNCCRLNFAFCDKHEFAVAIKIPP